MMKIESDGSMGPVEAVLELGREKDNRNIRLLKDHDAVEGNVRVKDLVRKGVIKLRDEQDTATHCLNFVHIWSTDAAGFIVGIPLFISVGLFCIAWPIVAVRHFGADVQTSIQTGVSIGGFVVTASKSTSPCVRPSTTFRIPFGLFVFTECSRTKQFVAGGLLIAFVAYLDTMGKLPR